MEIKIENINITEITKIVKSINWSYGEISGTFECKEPNPDNFIELEELNKDIVMEWLKDSIDFTKFDIVKIEEILPEKIISITLNN